jgi:murein endopeptidase
MAPVRRQSADAFKRVYSFCAKDPIVERIFVNAAIEKALCRDDAVSDHQ